MTVGAAPSPNFVSPSPGFEAPLHEVIGNGVINAADPSLKDLIVKLASIRNHAHADAERAAAALERVGPSIRRLSRLRAWNRWRLAFAVLY